MRKGGHLLIETAVTLRGLVLLQKHMLTAQAGLAISSSVKRYGRRNGGDETKRILNPFLPPKKWQGYGRFVTVMGIVKTTGGSFDVTRTGEGRSVSGQSPASEGARNRYTEVRKLSPERGGTGGETHSGCEDHEGMAKWRGRFLALGYHPLLPRTEKRPVRSIQGLAMTFRWCC